jgi:hypothetical protein
VKKCGSGKPFPILREHSLFASGRVLVLSIRPPRSHKILRGVVKSFVADRSDVAQAAVFCASCMRDLFLPATVAAPVVR